MGRRTTVQWVAGISIALALGSATVALALGAAADPPIERVGSFHSISTELSGTRSRPPHPATIASTQPRSTAADNTSTTTPSSPDAGPESREHEATHDRRDD